MTRRGRYTLLRYLVIDVSEAAELHRALLRYDAALQAFGRERFADVGYWLAAQLFHSSASGRRLECLEKLVAFLLFAAGALTKFSSRGEFCVRADPVVDQLVVAALFALGSELCVDWLIEIDTLIELPAYQIDLLPVRF